MNRLEKTAIISSAGNALIAAIKFFAGVTFGSIALVADAIHSFTDIITSIAVFFGIRFSEKKTKKFPYGLYKLENLVSLFIALIIFWTGAEILIESFEKFGSAEQITEIMPIAIGLIALVIAFALAKYKQKVAEEEHSPSMLSEAKHSMLDVYTTVGAVAAVVLSFAGFPVADPLIGFLIGLLVFKAGFEIFVDSARVLLDASIDYKTMRKIEKIVLQQGNVKIKEITARNSGRYVFVDLKLETNLKDLKKVSQLHKRCEEKIRQALPRIDKIMLDVEYRKKDVLEYAVPILENRMDSKIASEFGSAKYFCLFKATNNEKSNRVLETRIIENPHAKSDSRKGILTAELLTKNKADVPLTTHEMKKGGAFYALQENFVEMKTIKEKNLKNLLELFGEK
ncbi:MAG: cation diffusion facilitator family transporter [Candidatus Diapherotrites archaeon]|nr:cation diffusion facilitator family transporter [Candidatus Diapherotrites archaeon]